MAFIELPDNQGKIYIPEEKKGSRKKNCPDCFDCQWCSEDRCLSCRSVCRIQTPKIPRK